MKKKKKKNLNLLSRCVRYSTRCKHEDEKCRWMSKALVVICPRQIFQIHQISSELSKRWIPEHGESLYFVIPFRRHTCLQTLLIFAFLSTFFHYDFKRRKAFFFLRSLFPSFFFSHLSKFFFPRAFLSLKSNSFISSFFFFSVMWLRLISSKSDVSFHRSTSPQSSWASSSNRYSHLYFTTIGKNFLFKLFSYYR